MPGLPSAFIREALFISEHQSMQRLVIGQSVENKVTVSGQSLFRWTPPSMSPTGVTKAQESLLKRNVRARG